MLSKIDILNRTFSRAFRGYSRVEVDMFLQEVADSMGRLAEEKNQLRQRIVELEAGLKEHRGREKTLRDTLLTTQKMTNELKATAQKEAQLIIDAANGKAENLMNQAHLRVAQVHEDIQDLKKLRAQFEMKIRAVIDSFLKMMDMNQEEEEQIAAVESKVKFIKKAGER